MKATRPRTSISGQPQARLRTQLLRSSSIIAMVTVLATAHADAQTLSVLHAAQASANSVVAAKYPNGMPPSLPGNKNGSNSVGMAGAQFRALQYVQRVNQALDMGMQAQAAARAAAAAMDPGVPDGLAPGGLDPVPNPLPAAEDPTGLNTWQGADAPTQTGDSKGVQVTVHQTESRAILSWQTFNVGQKTSLVFAQSQNGTDQQSWVVLNRVVGQLDPSTGLRNPLLQPAPSQILGSIKAPGTVLILNQNGIIFGGTSQVNTGSLIATSLEIGRAVDVNTGPLSIRQRNNEFLTFGFLGFADEAAGQLSGAFTPFTFSAQEYTDSAGNVQFDPLLEGTVDVQAGAQVTTANGGYILLTGPKVINSGALTASQGQVSLQSGRDLKLVRSTGSADSTTPDVRGFTLVSSQPGGCQATGQCDYVENTTDGIISSSEGYLSLGSTFDGAIIEQGLLQASTSVSRNGYIQLSGADIQIAQNATLAITPFNSKETIPQDPTSLQDFKLSRISVGSEFSRVEIDQNAMLYAPAGNVDIGAAAGAIGSTDASNPGDSRVFVDNGAIIDVAGLTDVLIAASRNSILIDPVKGNELRDDPNYRNSFLNGAALLVDPRLSGVNENGVEWVGSPLIEAKSFAEQVGVTVQELMTRGGNVSLGAQSYAPGTDLALAPDITVKAGATIDISGGWVTYEGGFVQTSQLISVGGGLVDVGRADVNGSYVGLYGGFTESQARWGVSQTWGSLLLQGGHFDSTYTEGRDAGGLTLKGSTVVLDGTVIGNAYAGPRQIVDAATGTAASSIYGDTRHLQGAPSQLPSGGFLLVQALSSNASGGPILIGGGDIELVSQANYHPVDPSLPYGQSVSIDANGNLVVPVRDPNSLLPVERQDTISLSADALSSVGLSAVSLMTSGKITVDADANLTLAAGGAFEAIAGRTTTIDGSITIPSGAIQIQTINAGLGSVFLPDSAGPGSFDIVVNGTLSTKGRWANDFGATSDQMQGSAYTNGGSVVLIGAARQAEYQETATLEDTQNGTAPTTNVDISGSILLNESSLIDVSAGGYVNEKGALKLAAHGGNVSLIEQTAYFQLGDLTSDGVFPGGFSAFRVTENVVQEVPNLEVNPSEVTARVTLDGTIRADGFSGGGTFTLFTPQISFGDGTATTGTELPLDFFSKSGFANFEITSYKTDLEANVFNNGLGGYNALLATQVLTVGDGQTLLLSQSMFSPVLDTDQQNALRNLETGGDVYTVLTPTVPTDAWDQRAVNLTLGGLIELDVAKGGTILGAAGTSLAVGQLYNQGTIRLPGGTITQTEVLPQIYTQTNALAIHDLSDVFSVLPDGTINELDTSKYNGVLNGDLAAQYPMYLLGNLGRTDGIVLAAGSVTDLSGESIVNPRATGIATGGTFRDGRVIAGGTLETTSGLATPTTLFTTPIGTSDYTTLNPTTVITNDILAADPGSQISVAGASDTFDRLGANGKYVPTPEWSSAGTLSLGNDGNVLTGAIIDAHGGAAGALGGTLVMLDPVLYQNDPSTPTQNAVSSATIEGAGFDTFVAEGSLNSSGDVTLSLGRGFFLVSRPYDGHSDLGNSATRDKFAPVVGTGGVLEIDAPYIHFASSIQNVSTPVAGTPGTGSAIFRANEIDITGGLLFDQSVSNVELDALGDVRLTGVEPWQQVFNQGGETVPSSLLGQLAVNGDLLITAAQVYPTTGSTFYVTSSAADGTITFARAGGETPATPYSAGGSLLVQAANIVQGGIIRVPIGSLTIGSSQAFTIDNGGTPVTFAPATTSVDVTDGSITSVSADGMAIPYGTTTDQIEWFFAATGADELTAPPKAVLTMGGANVNVASGSTVDISGGGDLYAYEFISGTGGSHDVLDRFNNDAFSSGNGFQYPDGRQVYAIIPSISRAQTAAFDPIYSSDYGDLYSASAAGKQVYLADVPGLAAGWYTLLPAKYATLPGGMRVVENTGATNIVPGRSTTLVDGSYVVSGYYGTAGTGDQDSELHAFTVETQSVFDRYSNIALTSANLKFAALAAHNGQVVPQLPLDAGRLVLAPSDSLTIDATLTTSPGKGGRGAEVDISGSTFDIVSTAPVNGPQGAIVLTADELTNLNAASLLIGGVRTDNADGTTSLAITASSIVVENDAAHPLSGPEVVLAVDSSDATITLADGATILAKGNVTDTRSGDYIVDGSQNNAVLRVSAGPERQITLSNINSDATKGVLSVGVADLEGPSVLLDSSGDLTVSSSATIKTDALALGAGQVSFTDTGNGLSGLVITSALQALFSQAGDLIIRTPGTIAFSSGSYNFNNLTLDTPGLTLLDGDSVTLNTEKLTLANSQAAASTCGSSGAPACGGGDLSINATEIDFTNGTLRTFGFGGSDTLTATTGIFAEGTATFDAGSAAFNLQSPFIGDRALTLSPGESAAIPELAFVSTGAITVSDPGNATAGTFAGTPGATLSFSGDSVAVSGTTIRATAGTLDILAAHDVTIGTGAVLSTPGYAKNFGDSADPYIVYAPGGLLHLTAMDGSVDLQSGSLLSVGGGIGTAGTIELSAPQGNVIFDGTLDAQAPGGGASFVLDQKGAFNLAAFGSMFGDQFDGTIAIRTGSGDLTLGSGHTLQGQNVLLTADGGTVDIAGTIDVSGVSGGTVNLFGLDGVTLESGSNIYAQASGYGLHDTRQAHGGNVEIGTDDNGVINVQSGANIDVTAEQKGDRLVPILRNGKTYYVFAPADVGGSVEFRAPVIDGSNGETVNVFFDGAIAGASQIVLQGFERFDLAKIAADPNFVGVTINDAGQAVLDVGAVAGAGQANFLADYSDGTLVQFVQDFDISQANSQLGALTTSLSSVFHERPGMELDYSGDIVLASNWNLGAGTIDVAAAKADGYMGQLPDGQYYVLPGMESAIFSDPALTTLTYRTDGAVDGEPGVLTIRAGGTLDIKGSISDGFFQFRDQNDPDYLNRVLGGGDKYYTPYLSTGCTGGSCVDIGAWQPGDLQSFYVSIRVNLSSLLDNPVPYSALANSPAAPGSLAGGTGDPFGSAQLFPLLINPDGTPRAKPTVQSTSYQLVGGADLTGSALGTPSVDPMRTLPGTTGGLIIEGTGSYTYAGSRADSNSTYENNLLMSVNGQYVSPDAWYQSFLDAYPDLNADSYTFISFKDAPSSVVDFLINQAATFFAADQYQLIVQGRQVAGITTTMKLASEFIADVYSANFSSLVGDYKPPKPKVITAPTTALTRTLVRSGTGDIGLAAAGNIDLTNGAPVYRDLDGNIVSPEDGGLQVGGTAVYTAGHLVDPTPRTLVDALTGLTFDVDPSGFASTQDVFVNPPTYLYGAGGGSGEIGVGLSGVLIANPVYADGGGNISLSAGEDVLGRRDIWQQTRIAENYVTLINGGLETWIGPPDQIWRSGVIGNASDARINPQLFQEGVGALGGGNITISAGRDVSDISIVDDTTLTTAAIQASGSAATTLGLLVYGGGNVVVNAGRDLLGGRLDVGSGSAWIDVGRDIVSAGLIPVPGSTLQTQENELRIRLTDAFVSVQAGGDIDIQGIAALGVSGLTPVANLDARGFYSDKAGVSLLADGSVTVDNTGVDVITENDGATALTASAVYPGTFEATALTGNLTINTSSSNGASAVILYPSPVGELQLISGANIAQTEIAQEDGDPGLLPGLFSIFQATLDGVTSGRTFLFPGVLPSTTEVERQALHNRNATHAGDNVPNRIYAGGDILDMILSVAKQTRVGAGRDIVNMMFFGQNLATSDATRIVAGRDITATTKLIEPVIFVDLQKHIEEFGPPEAAVQGNTFVIGGPGSFFLEAGRDAGPFLNSAVTNGYENQGTSIVSTGEEIWGGGVLSVGNEWNPWLAAKGSDVYVEFGVGKGQDFDALRDYYLDPANLPNLNGDLFVQVKDSAGNSTPDRSQPIYAPILINWLQKNQAQVLESLYGTTAITFQQAYDAFKTLPELVQRVFMLGDVYFNELTQTSIPSGPSFKQYARGYQAVNLLFPSALGYTANDLSGGSNGANQTVETGDLDLRLATIQTSRGGNIFILGPGGRVLAGSTVRTSEQAARRTYDGGRLFAGNIWNSPFPAAIAQIPLGYEGILTLRGGSIYTFTDTDFLLNQSRLFTEAGGDIAMWSSNGDLNAGQGPKTSANFPPVVVQVDEDLFSQVNSVGGVSGAGIAAFEPAPGVAPPDVFLIAPRGTVDAGDAGVRVAGDLFIAALAVANAENFSVGGTSFGIPGAAAVDVAAETSASAASAAATQAAQSFVGAKNNEGAPSIITVELLGFDSENPDDEKRKKKGK
jgi:filamentous hemagglutinin family protein